MKILMLANGSSVHTARWVNVLHDAGLDIVLATQEEVAGAINSSIVIRRLPVSGGTGYFRNVPSLRRLLFEEQPDLLHTHYASGYGTAARLSGFKPLLLSVWGGDVYNFPERSFLHRWLLRGNLMAATRVACTSHAMAKQTKRIAPALEDIAVTPFGVDTTIFAPASIRNETSRGPIVIGTVKTLRQQYGLDVLIDSFHLLVRRLSVEAPEIAERLRLRIVGDGPLKETLKDQVTRRGLDRVTDFIAAVPHEMVPAALQELDIYVALSRRESFGVAIIEAGACGLPVVVSDVGGLPEVVPHEETGFVVPAENPQAAAEALRKLVLDPDLRRRMGEQGRQHVISHYEWQNNVRQMINLYEKVISDFSVAGHQ